LSRCFAVIAQRNVRPQFPQVIVKPVKRFVLENVPKRLPLNKTPLKVAETIPPQFH
jgi:hypothetical protein